MSKSPIAETDLGTPEAATAAKPAAAAILELAGALLPTVEPATIRAALHAWADRTRAALDGGATLRDLLDELRAATAPAPPVQVAEPWADLLTLAPGDRADRRSPRTTAWRGRSRSRTVEPAGAAPQG